MSADTDVLVFDMSSQSEGSPNGIFVKKDYLSLMDNQNQNYQGNQCIIDTSVLANSNKYINYREAYLMVPLLITATATLTDPPASTTKGGVTDFAFGLKNWLGSIINSISVDYNGTTGLIV